MATRRSLAWLAPAAAVALSAAALANSLSRAPAPTATVLAAAPADAASTVYPASTVYACVHDQARTFFDVSVTAAPTCPARSYRVSWSGQASMPPAPSTSPSPTASTSTSAPTSQTATPSPPPQAPVPSSTSFAFCSSVTFGSKRFPDGFTLNNDVWNSVQAGPQTICGNSGADWQATSTQGGSDPKSVKTYPSVQKNFSNEPLGQLRTLTSTYIQSMPANGDFEAAWDIWLDGNAKEVMVWVDNHGQTPAGTKQGTVTLGGLTWTLWATSRGYWAFVLDHNAPFGTINLLAELDYLQSTGALSASDQLRQVDFGWEICSTLNQPEVFKVTNYALSSS